MSVATGRTIPVGTLAKLKKQALSVDQAAQLAYLASRSPSNMVGGKPVEDHLRDTFEGSQTLARSISHIIGPDLEVSTSASEIPLHLLDTLDTRRLLALLDEALAVAERVDMARGRFVPGLPISPGETVGCDLAEAIGQIRLRLSEEVLGPGAGVTGGRE